MTLKKKSIETYEMLLLDKPLVVRQLLLSFRLVGNVLRRSGHGRKQRRRQWRPGRRRRGIRLGLQESRMKSWIGWRDRGRTRRSLLMHVPLLLLLLLLLNGRPTSTNKWRLLLVDHVRMDRLEIALRPVHLHRLLLLLLLHLLVLNDIGSVRMLENLLLLMLRVLDLARVDMNVLLVLVVLVVQVVLVVVLLLLLLLLRLLHEMRMNGSWRR